jgi:putative transposase
VLGNLDAGGMKIKYKIICEASESNTVTDLCELFGVSRSGYYAFVKRKDKDPDEFFKRLIMKVYMKYDCKYGYRQIQMHLLQDHQELVNHKKVLRLMQAMGIRSRIRVKRQQSSVGVGGDRVAENLLHQKWVTDVTQYRVYDTKFYLSTIKDLFNGEIIASHMSLRNDNQLVLQTFSKAFEKKADVTGLIVHSDQGSQYTSHDYHNMLLKVHVRISMSRRGNCFDNASLESFFSQLKAEALYLYHIRSVEGAQRR